MTAVVESTRGTAHYVLTTDAIKIAAKTGTGQSGISDNHNHSWVVSYAPRDAPIKDQIIIVIWIDAKNEWEWWAPKAMNIMYNGIFKDLTYEENVIDLMPLYYLPDKNTYEESNIIIREELKKRNKLYEIKAPIKEEEEINEEGIIDIEEENDEDILIDIEEEPNIEDLFNQETLEENADSLIKEDKKEENDEDKD